MYSTTTPQKQKRKIAINLKKIKSIEVFSKVKTVKDTLNLRTKINREWMKKMLLHRLNIGISKIYNKECNTKQHNKIKSTHNLIVTILQKIMRPKKTLKLRNNYNNNPIYDLLYTPFYLLSL